MSARLGIAVSANAIRAMLVHDRRIAWHAQEPVESFEQLGDRLAALLQKIPPTRFARARAVAAIGPSSSQVKQLRGLPPIEDANSISALLSPNVNRFFLKNGVPLRVSEIHQRDQERWAAVADEPVVAIVEDICRRSRIKLDGCVPSAVALSRSFGDGILVWRDGPAVSYLSFVDGDVARLTRREGVLSGAIALPVPELAAMGANGSQFADAYGAALCTRRSPLVWRIKSSREAQQRKGRLLGVLVGLILVTATLAFLAPGLAAERARRLAAARLASLQAAATEVARQNRELERVSKELDQIALFAADRRSMVSLLGHIAQILPESTAILNIHVDSVGGNIVMLSTSGAEILPEIAQADGLASADLVGTVSSQNSGSTRLQRMTLRFRLPKGDGTAARANK